MNIFSDFEHKVWSKFWSWGSAKIVKPQFGQYFAAGLVEVLKLNRSHDYEARFGQDFEVSSLVKMLMFGWDFKVDQDLCNNLWYGLEKLLW